MRGRSSVVLVGAAVLALAGCSTGGDAAPQVPIPTLTSSPGATAAESDELATFDAVGRDVAATTNPKGRDFIAALVEAGFDDDAMELTPDKTAIGLDVSAVEYSVRVADTCLIGQWGPDMGYHSEVVAPLATGLCLVGATVDLRG